MLLGVFTSRAAVRSAWSYGGLSVFLGTFVPLELPFKCTSYLLRFNLLYSKFGYHKFFPFLLLSLLPSVLLLAQEYLDAAGSLKNLVLLVLTPIYHFSNH